MSSTSDDKQIGERLYRKRNELGLSQQALANSLGISLRTYQNYERGDRPVSKEFLFAIMERHGVDPTWLLTGHKGEVVSSGEIDTHLMEEIIEALTAEDSELRYLPPSNLVRAFCLIYNQTSAISDESERLKIIPSAVKLLSINMLQRAIDRSTDSELSKQFPDITAAEKQLSEERMNSLKAGLGDSDLVERLNRAGAQSAEKDEPSSQLNQNVEGSNNQVAGRDVVSKDSGRKEGNK